MTRTSHEDKPTTLTCRAEFIFDVKRRAKTSKPIKVLSDCMCDYRRPDWESRWKDWKAHGSPYLNLFLCREHAQKLGLME